MKKAFISALSLLLSIHLSAQPKSVFSTGSFDLKGKILYYHQGSNNGFIMIRTYSVKGESKDSSISINQAGEFSCSLHQPFEGDIEFTYAGRYLILYIACPETVFLQIDDKKWASGGNITKAIYLKGKSAFISNKINDFRYALSRQHFKNIIDKPWEMSDDDFSKAKQARMKEELGYLKSYISTEKITSNQFTAWCKNDIIYDAGTQVATHCFSGKFNSSITYPQLTGLLEFFPVNNKNALHNSAYYSFLHWLATDFEIIANINTLYKDTIKTGGNNRLLFILDKIDTHSAGLAKELMYYSVYDNKNEDCAYLLIRFTSVIAEPYLAKALQYSITTAGDLFQPYNIADRIKSQPGGDSVAAKLEQILREHPGVYVLVDFWGSWCAPCMMEMANYPKLIDSLRGKPLAFLFIAVETSTEKINAIKNQFHIEGDFIAVTKNETQVLNNAFGFSSYPGHFIIDPHGKVVSERLNNLFAGNEIAGGTFEAIKQILSNSAGGPMQ